MESRENKRGRRFFSKKALVPAVLIIAAGIALLFPVLRRPRTVKSAVNVYVDGTLHESIPIGEERTITVERDGNSNVILFEKDGVRMLSSTCRNQICVHTGKLFYADTGALDLNSWIVCLPNKVSVEVITEDP